MTPIALIVVMLAGALVSYEVKKITDRLDKQKEILDQINDRLRDLES